MDSEKIFINGATFGKVVSKTSTDQGGFGYGGSINVSVGRHEKNSKKAVYTPAYNSLAEHIAAELNKTYVNEDDKK